MPDKPYSPSTPGLTPGSAIPWKTDLLRKRRLTSGPLDPRRESLTTLESGKELHDKILLARFLQEQDDRAFQRLIERHQAMILGVCYRILRNPHDVREVFQTVCLNLAKSAPSLQPERSLAGWLYRVTVNAALKLRLRQQSERAECLSLQEESDLCFDPEDQVRLLDLQRVIDEELDALPEKLRLPMILCYLENYSYEKAAQELGLSYSALKMRLERGRRILRKRFERRGLRVHGAMLALLLTSLSEKPISSHPPLAHLQTLMRTPSIDGVPDLYRLPWSVIAMPSVGDLRRGLSIILAFTCLALGFQQTCPLVEAPFILSNLCHSSSLVALHETWQQLQRAIETARLRNQVLRRTLESIQEEIQAWSHPQPPFLLRLAAKHLKPSSFSPWLSHGSKRQFLSTFQNRFAVKNSLGDHSPPGDSSEGGRETIRPIYSRSFSDVS